MSKEQEREIVVALAGNPNSGKTTIFNNLTGAHQHVGNYPGVTVEKKEGERRYKGRRLRFVDLPGTYSLSAYSVEELVARNFLLDETPDVVVDVVDSSNLERNLYLGLQLLEMEQPAILVFNMADEARKRGLEIDQALLSQLLGAPIVPTEGHRGVGMTELLDRIIELSEQKRDRPGGAPAIRRLPPDIETERQEIAALIRAEPAVCARRDPAWLAMKLLECDEAARNAVRRMGGDPDRILSAADAAVERLRSKLGDEPEILIGDHRYGVISGACREAVRAAGVSRRSLSDAIDRVLTNRLLGLPIFLVMMWLVFQATFRLGQPLMDGIEAGFTFLGRVASENIGDPLWRSLVVDGVIGGVGGVLVFVPAILILFFAIAMLEDSGYMARAAFLMDKVMHWLGLHGKSFIPMLIGFGCNVPAIMSTRTLESRRDRYTTMLVVPFMSCGARLPVYALLAAAFFKPEQAGNVMFSIYLLGIVVAALMARLLRSTLFRGETSPFLMELPPYRIPTWRSVVMHMWRRAWMYLRKAGTIILLFALVIWSLTQFPRNPEPTRADRGRLAAAPSAEARERMAAEIRLRESYAGRMGAAVGWALRPAGLDHWKIGTALVAGFGAKEVVVATLGTLYSVGEEQEEALRDRLAADPFFSPLVAYTMMVFVLLYVPCVATVAVVRQETRSWRWPLFHIVYTTATAWIVSVLVYQGGRLLGLG
jgi:ferrous iron transport protein B